VSEPTVGAASFEAFAALARRRRMCRDFDPVPLDQARLADVLTVATSGPSAGFTQGIRLVVLTGADVAAFWNAIGDAPAPGPGVRRAPALVVAVGSRDEYLARYAEPDKAYTHRADAVWPTPWWIVDPSFAVMLLLLAADAAGLGALFFAVPPDALDAVGGLVDVGEQAQPIGVVALGERASSAVSGSPRRRPRRPAGEIIVGPGGTSWPPAH
jgi:nitroreductase